MQDGLSHKVYTVADIYAAYNMGMEWAMRILEAAEGLSPEGRQYLIQELRKDIARTGTIPKSSSLPFDEPAL